VRAVVHRFRIARERRQHDALLERDDRSRDDHDRTLAAILLVRNIHADRADILDFFDALDLFQLIADGRGKHEAAAGDALRSGHEQIWVQRHIQPALQRIVAGARDAGERNHESQREHQGGHCS